MEQFASQVIEKMQVLPREKQQEVLDFVDFLVSRITIHKPEQLQTQTHEISFTQVARQYIGCVEGPGDLSTNPDYMESYGQS
ncbi:MAG: DUF2281 domain-containing protein [Cyanobacteria bacterium P01_G01_bin.54]